MKCPSCGTEEAYIGFSDIDCPNKLCKHFQGGATALAGDTVPTVPTPTTRSGPNIHPLPGGWGYPQGGTPVIAPPNLTIRVSGVQPLRNNVKVSFIAGGDPGNPDKEVEIYFDIGNGDQLCTLSSPNITYVGGVDADGSSIYTTNWLCTQDGVQPTDAYQLKATIC